MWNVNTPLSIGKFNAVSMSEYFCPGAMYESKGPALLLRIQLPWALLAPLAIYIMWIIFNPQGERAKSSGPISAEGSQDAQG